MKKILLGCLGLSLLIGCASTTIKKEDILLEAQQIRAAIQSEPIKIEESTPFPSPSILEIGRPVEPLYAVLANEETLVYKAKFLAISIGDFTFHNQGMTMINGRSAYRFELSVRALPFFIKLFKVKDRYVSFLDAQKLVVLRHEEYIGGGNLLESTVDFNHITHTATHKNLLTRQEKIVPIPDKIFDVLSGSYYLRMIPWQLGDTVELNVYADEKIYEYVGLLHSKAKVNLSQSPQDAYLLKPYVFLNGEPIKKISAEVFFSTPTPRKTLRASLKSLVGSVSVVLVEGL